MSEHQQTQQSKITDNTSQKQTIPPKYIPTSHPIAIIQRARINPKSLTHADVMQLQRTIGNKAVGKLLTEIGLVPLKVTQAPPVQLQPIPEEDEEPLQGKFENKPEQETCISCSTLSIQQTKENLTGMPDNLKAGVESLSGIDMGDVRVHYNSDKPAEVGALAYAQGTDIHVAPGQERHLPHEAWHIVQQSQGRVRPTMQLKNLGVNNDVLLEREADEMGSKALIIDKKSQISEIISKNDIVMQSKAMKKNDVLQLKLISVGYDKFDLGGFEDTLVTSGLRNCIAVVVYNINDQEKARKAVMGHINTSYVINTTKLKNTKFDGKNGEVNIRGLQSMKATLDEELNHALGKTNKDKHGYSFVLGTSWGNMVSMESKQNFVLGLTEFLDNAIFCGIGLTAEFNVTSQEMVAENFVFDFQGSDWNREGGKKLWYLPRGGK
jgi:hypothetical protein